MEAEYPEWANEKQLEGMKLFASIADEYLWDKHVSFKPHSYGDDDANESRFIAILRWDREKLGMRENEFDIAFDYEAKWDHLGNRIEEWQFLFSGGEATRELSNEILFMNLFWYMDDSAIIPKENPCIQAIKSALEKCHQAFRERKHGGVAERELRHDLENILGINYQ